MTAQLVNVASGGAFPGAGTPLTTPTTVTRPPTNNGGTTAATPITVTRLSNNGDKAKQQRRQGQRWTGADNNGSTVTDGGRRHRRARTHRCQPQPGQMVEEPGIAKPGASGQGQPRLQRATAVFRSAASMTGIVSWRLPSPRGAWCAVVWPVDRCWPRGEAQRERACEEPGQPGSSHRAWSRHRR